VRDVSLILHESGELAPAESKRPMTRKRILLVDDSETILQMESMILQQDRYEVVTARNGQEGIVKALEVKPDLILMDVLMPQLDGFAALKRLREHPDMTRIPIVMVTSKAEAESMECGYESGCSDYIIKPIDRMELVAKVKNLLGD
jgi:DNA-binding response OmpR family regulator